MGDMVKKGATDGEAESSVTAAVGPRIHCVMERHDTEGGILSKAHQSNDSF